jgi:hypothetical protein
MAHASILTDEFDKAAAKASWDARRAALAAGHAVVFVAQDGRYLKELPDGRLFEVRLDPTKTGEAHCVVLREVSSTAA